jgi:hypothetical protein
MKTLSAAVTATLSFRPHVIEQAVFITVSTAIVKFKKRRIRWVTRRKTFYAQCSTTASCSSLGARSSHQLQRLFGSYEIDHSSTEDSFVQHLVVTTAHVNFV